MSIRLEHRYGEYGVAPELLLMFPLRFFSSIRVFFRHPLDSIAAIPDNFTRNVFVIDFTIPPHFLPGGEDLKASPYNWNSYDMLKEAVEAFYELAKENVVPAFKGDPPTFGLFRYVAGFSNSTVEQFVGRPLRKAVFTLLLVLFLIIFLPIMFTIGLVTVATPIAFRWSIKSTFPFWLPLLWVRYQSTPAKGVFTELEEIKNGLRFKITLIFSTLAMASVVVKYACLYLGFMLGNTELPGPLGTMVIRIIAPFEVQAWQIVGFLNGCLSWALLDRAGRHLRSRGKASAWPEERIEVEYRIIKIVQTVITLYVEACTFYIVAATAWNTEWPHVRFVLFPWD